MTTSMNRRSFLKGTLAAGAIAAAAGSGLLTPRRALAAEWPKAAFTTKSVDDALKDLFGTSATTESSEVKLRAPILAENGAVVPIAVSTKLPNVEAISILVHNNPNALATTLALTPATGGFYSTRIKMAKTSDVTAVVRAGGKLYSTKQLVKVTVGGCGG